MKNIARGIYAAGLTLAAITAGQADTILRQKTFDLSKANDPSVFKLYNTQVLSIGADTEGLRMASLYFKSYRATFGQSLPVGQDWSPYNMLVMKVANREARTVPYRMLIYLTSDPNNTTNMFSGDFTLGPNEVRRFVFHLNQDNPLLYGLKFMRPVLTAPYKSIYSNKVTRDLRSIYHWRLSIQDSSPARADISDLRLIRQNLVFDQMVDEFGQYTDRTWASKVYSTNDFLAKKAAEMTDLSANPGPGEVEGTRRILSATAGTGRWRIVTQSSGMKYFQHPNGNLFWCLGTSAIVESAPTPVEGREHYYRSLPDPLGRFANCYSRRSTKNGTKLCYDHQLQNIMLKYGDSPVPAWLSTMRSRIRSWGLNCVGMQSHPSLYDGSIPYTTIEHTKDYSIKLSLPSMLWGPMADPYGADFGTWLTARLTKNLASHNARRNFLGLYVDNELPWGNMTSEAGRYNLALGALKASSTQPAKVALINQLKSKYSTIGSLNSAWGTSFSSWDTILTGAFAPRTFPSAMAADFQAYNKAFARRYHSIVRDSLTRAGLTGLYLGCRYIADYNKDVVEAATPYVDVHSINFYRPADRVDWAYLNSLGKPVIISELGFGVQGGNTFGGPSEVSSQSERCVFVKAFLDAAHAQPNVVGVQLYCYNDMPITGRASDYANAGMGLVDVTDTPHTAVVNLLREFAKKMYISRG